ncbi:glycosyltransferase family 2 protein [Desulfolutivibrio sulfoxidireducens]|uniref:glycosyltransferase family 2 protein n=1 Tax=Desulfolutivibrio sulfoxidireducens TaxID=2773299 RepID=UPI00159E99AB|nr:glycosyltransferase [Desulfolutivibrio sulfoxidireducens]QLA16763.1 glycosyltransferase [Desulfolutivibrio sulfoxidireducens]
MDVFSTASTVPETLRRVLIAGGDGRPELERAAALAESLARESASPGERAPAGDDLARLARDLRLAVFEADPLDGRGAGAVLALDAVTPFLDRPRRELARAVSALDAPPADTRYLVRLLERREHDKTLAYLESRRAEEPRNLFWTRQLAGLALAAGDSQAAVRAASRLRRPPFGMLASLADLIEGDAAFLRQDDEAAERLWAGCPLAVARARRAEALVRLDRRDEAISLMRHDLAERPWNIATLLRLHDVARGIDRATATLQCGLALLLYTFNKAADLDHTLAGLYRADLSFAPGARIVVLDNGSTDATPDVLAAWADRLGPGLFERVDLPVNIGAPAARNWLMRHRAAREAAWLAFLDDDADPPPEFIGRLAAAATAYPGAGVYGCRVVDAGNPSHIQSADLFLEPLPQVPGAPPFSRGFEISRAHLHALDMGRFDYLRPCASVTGCCHLFAATTLREVGDFDIRLSPSQYDDLDHDLRGLLKNRVPIYQGHLRVAHRKQTGSQGRPGGRHYAAGFANQFKLHQFHSSEEFETMARAAFDAAFRDACSKRAWLGER